MQLVPWRIVPAVGTTCLALTVGMVLFFGVMPVGTSADSGRPNVYDPVWSPDGQRIAFYSDAGGDSEIYSVELSSGQLTRLTNRPGHESNPEWIGDGRKLSFTSDREGKKEIYRLDLDTKVVERVTFNDYPESAHSWSPDGKAVAFESNREGNHDIFVLFPDGVEKRLTYQPGNDFRPTWCASSGRIVFQSKRGDFYHLYSMTPKGADVRQLTSANRHEAGPDCGPRSGRIVYVAHREDGRSTIHVMAADGSEDRELTDGSKGSDIAPSWSPDERRIVFYSNRDGFLSLYQMAADGSGQQRIETDFALARDLGNASWTVGREDADEHEVGRAIGDYIKGWREADQKRLAGVFDLKEGRVMWLAERDEKQVLDSMTFGEVIRRGRPQAAFGLDWKILSLDVIDGQLAVAKVSISRDGGSYVDVLTLQKIAGDWKIVSKAFVVRTDSK